MVRGGRLLSTTPRRFQWHGCRGRGPFHLGQLRDAPPEVGVGAELGVEVGDDRVLGDPAADDPGAEAGDVDVVVLDALPGDVGVVIGSACVSIVEGVAESVGAKTNAQRAKVTFDFLLAVAAEFGIRLELDDFVRGSRRARN